MPFGAFLIGIAFIVIHLLANKLIPANKIKQVQWFSFSGGLAVSYVFVYVLPSLHREQMKIEEFSNQLAMESELYFIGLIGVLIFYGVQKLARKRRSMTPNGGWVFWLQLLFFAIYNMLIAYIVVSSRVTGVQAVFYGIAIGMHFIAIAHDLWRENSYIYNRIGRYILATGIICGWIMGLLLSLSHVQQSIIFAFISGAMILNVLKYELPSDQESHFPTFAFGVVSYTILTLSLKFFFEW
ncbi:MULTISPECIES: hypothetical protein [Bacillaceae]|uniref:Uncharacterized protein n=1 Tax=Evansella alkalicola TaxID=745819 RepID=A0ABS6JSE1_9BACI|nr:MULTISPECIES: hypothetical protein [Bacillaceae]MBU9721493.1 hypothetical protein [Bacillus alkalicola]